MLPGEPVDLNCMRPRESATAGTPDADAADRAYLDGVECERVGRLSEALEHYRRAVALRTDHAAAHNNIGVLRQQWGQMADAVVAYQRAVESHPQFGLAWFNLGNCLARRESPGRGGRLL